MKLDIKHKISIKILLWIFLQMLMVVIAIFVIFKPLTIFAIIFYFFAFSYLALKRIFWTFEISEDQFNISNGILFKESKTIKYNKLQSVERRAGPLMRIIGLSKMIFFTSSTEQITVSRGVSHTKPEILFLDKKNADWLEDFINERIED